MQHHSVTIIQLHHLCNNILLKVKEPISITCTSKPAKCTT